MSHITVSIIQTKLHWEDKEANLNMLQEKIASIKEKTQVVILPEMFSTGFSMRPEALAEKMDGNTVRWMKDVAAQNKVIVTGSVIIEEGGEYFNRAIWMLPNGEYGYYDKRHLFGYAGEDAHYTGGSKRFIASVNGWRIQLIVCYDLRFPVWIRQQPSATEDFEYDLIICVANWPERRAIAWKTLLAARAIENQCYVAGVNRVGDDGNGIYHGGESSIISPLGDVLYQKKDDEDIYTVVLEKKELELVRSKLPFSKDSDKFQLLI